MNERMKQLADSLISGGPSWIFKGFTVVGLVMYAFFALVVLRQVAVMTQSFDSEVNGSVKAFARLHLIITLFLLGVAIVVL